MLCKTCGLAHRAKHNGPWAPVSWVPSLPQCGVDGNPGTSVGLCPHLLGFTWAAWTKGWLCSQVCTWSSFEPSTPVETKGVLSPRPCVPWPPPCIQEGNEQNPRSKSGVSQSPCPARVVPGSPSRGPWSCGQCQLGRK